MAQLEFRDISHSYELSSGLVKQKTEIRWAIKNMNLIWENGTANALLGPSGCGKTTMLNIISGLLRPTKGLIYIDGQDVTDLSPRERHIAQVFQFPVVYDSMNVYNNLAFPLINKNLPKQKIDKKVREIAEILDLTDYLFYPSSKLNSAEKQKISLGRGIIREDTVAILLDEPLTVIDPKMKGELRRKLKHIQKELKITMIYVTHDQHEALTFADYVTIVKDGKIIQSGTPGDLYAEPVEPFVGYFIGSPGMNFIDCKLTKKGLDCKKFNLKISDKLRSKLVNKGDIFTLGIRPESIIVSKEINNGGIPFIVSIIENFGNNRIITLEIKGIRIKSRVDLSMSVIEGEEVFIKFPEDNLKIFKDKRRIF